MSVYDIPTLTRIRPPLPVPYRLFPLSVYNLTPFLVHIPPFLYSLLSILSYFYLRSSICIFPLPAVFLPCLFSHPVIPSCLSVPVFFLCISSPVFPLYIFAFRFPRFVSPQLSPLPPPPFFLPYLSYPSYSSFPFLPNFPLFTSNYSPLFSTPFPFSVLPKKRPPLSPSRSLLFLPSTSYPLDPPLPSQAPSQTTTPPPCALSRSLFITPDC